MLMFYEEWVRDGPASIRNEFLMKNIINRWQTVSWSRSTIDINNEMRIIHLNLFLTIIEICFEKRSIKFQNTFSKPEGFFEENLSLTIVEMGKHRYQIMTSIA